jgi:hypothetical protein
VDEKKRLSRRQFLIGAAAALGGSSLLWAQRPGAMQPVTGLEPSVTPAAYLPFVARGRTALPYWGRVVHLHSDDATHWAGEPDYWSHIDQDVVNDMVERGLVELTGTTTVTDAWRALIPAYQPGERIAIKVNLNNTHVCDSTSPNIDALIQPINAIAGGLAQMGVKASDICVYDAVRAVPDRLVDGDLNGVSFFDGSGCRNEAGFSYTPGTRVAFYHPLGDPMPEEHVTDVLMNATYLINMPIMKGTHPCTGVTLGFKNHFGTIDWCSALHDYVNAVSKPGPYRSDYNPLVDLMLSPLIGGKTVLTIGDGLFAAKDFSQPPELWTTFGEKVPNSLFFAKDPVAIDCLMHDLLAAEPGARVPEGMNNYLRLAEGAGLGIFEQGDPWQAPYGSGYDSIEYVRVEL